MQRDGRLVALRYLQRRGGMAGVPVRADNREHLPVAHAGEYRVRVGTGIDHDDFLIVTHDPGIRRGHYLVYPGFHASLPFALTRAPAATSRIANISGQNPSPEDALNHPLTGAAPVACMTSRSYACGAIVSQPIR